MRAFILALAMVATAPLARAEPPPAAVEERLVVVKRETLETIMAEAEAAQEKRKLLEQCQADVARLAQQREEPEDRWRALKWSGITAAVIGAFVVGVWVGH